MTTTGTTEIAVALGLLATALQPALVVTLLHLLTLWRTRSVTGAILRRLRLARPGSFAPHRRKAATLASTASTADHPNALPRAVRLPGPYFDIALAGLIAIVITTVVLGKTLAPPATIPLGIVAGMAALFDLRWFWLPDRLTLPLIVLGLADGIVHDQTATAVSGLVAGGGGFWLIRTAYQAVRKVEGLGLGDVKFAAAMGAWLGPERLPAAIGLAAGLAILATVLRPLATGALPARSQRIPFGSFLAVALWTIWIATPD